MQRLTIVSTLSLASLLAFTLAIAACSRRDDDRAISAAPDLAAASASALTRTPPLTPPPAGTAGSATNPLAMPLKHDGPASSASSPSMDDVNADPCAIPDRSGPLAMRLRHDGPPPPPGQRQRNPLCMRIK